MRKFIAIRGGPNCHPGDWFIGEEVGEPLYKCRLTSGPQGAHLSQISRVGIPFELLADYIVEPGFRIPRHLLPNISARGEVKEIREFQSAFEEEIEEELLRRGKEANPSILGPSGVVVPETPDDPA